MSSYIPFAQREEFKDIVPILQDDGPNPLVPIAYTQQYLDGMNTFRGLVATGELSLRGLTLTEILIKLNPGHYSIWAYRAKILISTQLYLGKELDLLDELVKEHLKSYQVWQHRRNIVLELESSAKELSFTTKALSYDSKNYHTWAYRQWILCHFFSSTASDSPPPSNKPTSTAITDFMTQISVWEGEIDYVNELLEKDIRNNSAWNHRFFVCFESGQGGEVDLITRREISYVKEQLALAPNNPSAWNYLRGVLKHTSTSFSTLSSFVTPLTLSTRTISTNLEDPIVSAAAQLPAYLAIEFLADAAAENDANDQKELAAELFKSLIAFDPIRTNYYNHRAVQVLEA